MSNRDYYPLAEAAAALSCDENDLLHMAARGDFDAAVLLGGHAIVKKTVVDNTGAEVSVSFGGFPGYVVKIERGCIQSHEAGLPARVTLAIYYGRDGGNSEVLTIVDPMEEDGDLLKAGDFMMKDARLVIFADDLKRLQEIFQKADDGADSKAITEPLSKKCEANNQDETPPNEQELTQWLRESWKTENKPEGTRFFSILKRYVNEKGSPITQHYSAGTDAGISWKTSSGNTGETRKRSILNKVSIFKRTL